MIKFPFTSFQQFNLDWIMQMLHKILDFMPLNGVAGDVLQRTVDGAAWQPIAALSMDIHSLSPIAGTDGADELPIYDNDLQGNYKVTVQDIMQEAPVQSVNAQTGDVVLSIPTDTSDLTNGAGFVDAAGAAVAAPVQSVNGQTGNVTVSGGAVDSVNGQTGTVVITKSLIGLGNVDNVQQYSASNPPPYPVTSVNGQTGDVVVASGSGIDVIGGTSGVCTNAGQAGYGIVSNIDRLTWKLSDDKKWLVLSGYFDINFGSVSDYSTLDLGGFTLNTTGQTGSWKNAFNFYNSSGQLDLDVMKSSYTSLIRLSNDKIRIAIGNPVSTGSYTIVFNNVLIQVDA